MQDKKKGPPSYVIDAMNGTTHIINPDATITNREELGLRFYASDAMSRTSSPNPPGEETSEAIPHAGVSDPNPDGPKDYVTTSTYDEEGNLIPHIWLGSNDEAKDVKQSRG